MNESGTNPTKPDSQKQPEGAYQEINAAIQELYRLMGAPRGTPSAMSEPYFPGYSVYTYPSAGPGYVQGWPGVGANPARTMASPVADPMSAASYMNCHPAMTCAGHAPGAYPATGYAPQMPGWVAAGPY